MYSVVVKSKHFFALSTIMGRRIALRWARHQARKQAKKGSWRWFRAIYNEGARVNTERAASKTLKSRTTLGTASTQTQNPGLQKHSRPLGALKSSRKPLSLTRKS